MQRSNNTVRNIGWGFIYQILSLLLPFVIRTIILRMLGEQYLGLSSLFASILSVLNMAELGFSSAIVFSMYKPIAEKDDATICALMAFYRKVYAVIGMVVLVLGVSLMPFLDQLISGEYPADINLYILYGIYLFNAVISYFLFSYKTALLSAFHRNDLSSKISIAVTLIQHGIQIVILYVFKNYYLYIAMLPVATVITNLSNDRLTRKFYPQYVCSGVLQDEVKKTIKKQVEGLMVSKICGTLRNSLDSIILSAFFGLATVAAYSNYYYILNAVHGILTIIGVSMKAGVGNSIIKETKEKNYEDLKKFTFTYAWLAGWLSCCMLCLYQPFMLIWTGKEEMVFPEHIMTLFCVYFFCVCMMDMRNVYMDAIGLWWEARIRSIAEGIGNLILNLVLGYFFGVIGIIFATLITLVTINLGYGTKILFDNFFSKQKLLEYLGQMVLYFVVTCVVAAICYIICELLPFTSYLNLILRACVCVVVPNVLFVLLYSKNSNFVATRDFFLVRIGSFVKK